MPTGSPSPLSAEQIDHVRDELAAGRLPMVWFTPAAVGVDAGRSAKVVALTEPDEGDFIQVRPTGSHDTLSFSPNELTMDKPPRRRKAAEPEPPPAPPQPQRPKIDELLVVRERPTRKPPAQTRAAEPERPSHPATSPGAAVPASPRRSWSRSARTPRASGPSRCSPAVAARSSRNLCPPGSVASAARALGGDIEAAIEGALSAARDQQRARVEQLEAELADPRRFGRTGRLSPPHGSFTIGAIGVTLGVPLTHRGGPSWDRLPKTPRRPAAAAAAPTAPDPGAAAVPSCK